MGRIPAHHPYSITTIQFFYKYIRISQHQCGAFLVLGKFWKNFEWGFLERGNSKKNSWNFKKSFGEDNLESIKAERNRGSVREI